MTVALIFYGNTALMLCVGRSFNETVHFLQCGQQETTN